MVGCGKCYVRHFKTDPIVEEVIIKEIISPYVVYICIYLYIYIFGVRKKNHQTLISNLLLYFTTYHMSYIPVHTLFFSLSTLQQAGNPVISVPNRMAILYLPATSRTLHNASFYTTFHYHKTVIQNKINKTSAVARFSPIKFILITFMYFHNKLHYTHVILIY